MSSIEEIRPESSAVSNAGHRFLQWLEDIGDWANPILVKETRQALKSRQFVSTFLLLLLASWVASVLGVVWAGNSIEYGQAGRTFFMIFYVVLSIAALVVVPFGAFRSLLNERDESTYELLSITALTPKQIVWGKLLSAFVQVFLFYSAIAPFIAFTSLLQGFELAQVSYLLILLLFVSLGYSMSALVLSTLARQKHTQVFLTLAMLALSGWGFFTFLAMAFSAFTFVAFDSSDFWIGNGLVLLAFVTYFALFLQIATAQLTFDADNRSTGIRITMSVQFFLLWLCIVGMTLYVGTTPGVEQLQFFGVVSALHWAVGGLFAVTEPDTLSRRILKKRPKSRLRRTLLAPFLPGGSRGYFYVLLHIVALWLFVAGYYAYFSPTAPFVSRPGMPSGVPADPMEFMTAVCCYVVIYLGLATFLARVGQAIAPDIRPGHIRMITILIALFGIIFPYLLRILESSRSWENSYIDVLNPFSALGRLSGREWMTTYVYMLLGAAVVAVVVNLNPMLQQMTEATKDLDDDGSSDEPATNAAAVEGAV